MSAPADLPILEVQDLRKVFVDRGTRYEADKGEHDDLVMAWGIAWQARKQPRKGTVLV